ncbi:MAG TPA: ATPase, T2SS/T4P/T4SS family [Candidatus Wallbacteria bacterium]|nr:ATPase, T2SS/T4P/T4SS family [Candidatus Wallbacteria bacterium]
MDKIILSNFFAHFAQMLASGKPLLDAVIASGKKSYMNGHRGFVNYLAASIKSGKSLGQALLNIDFPKEYIGYFNAGEWEGRLDQTMNELALALKSDAKTGGEINLNLSGKSTGEKSNGGEILPTGADKTESENDSDSETYTDAEYKQTVKLVNGWLKKCSDAGASDMHIIPVRGGDGVLKFRAGGALREIEKIGRDELIKAVARIKFMSCLDVAEKRLPQDGRMIIKIGEKELDLRVSIVPSLTGEKVTIRFISKNEIMIGIDEIKLSADELEELKKMTDRPYGLILVTGMSGSGKTTTCYSILNEYIKKDCNVVTIEQPAEYLLSGATQIALDPSIGLNCLAALKTAMRTDPDVIFISGPFAGDPSDRDILNYAIKAAQTGHIVICQFGCKNIFELIDSLLKTKDIDPAALANILNGAVAQVLLRKLCGCKKAADTTPPAFIKKSKNAAIYMSAGCEKCLNSGYMGRVPVYDVITFGRDIKEAIASGDIEKIKKMTTGHLEKKAAELVKAGITSLEELYRVFGQFFQA